MDIHRIIIALITSLLATFPTTGFVSAKDTKTANNTDTTFVIRTGKNYVDIEVTTDLLVEYKIPHRIESDYPIANCAGLFVGGVEIDSFSQEDAYDTLYVQILLRQSGGKIVKLVSGNCPTAK